MIKLKEELKKVSNNKLSRIKIIAKQVRNELETHYDWNADKGCFRNTCHDITKDLAEKLKEEGIYAYRTNGLYYGASDEFQPDTSDWEDEDRDEYNNATEDGRFSSMFGFNHWWVVAENKWIIDITADQFHPNEENEYRVVITTIDDSDYNS